MRQYCQMTLPRFRENRRRLCYFAPLCHSDLLLLMKLSACRQNLQRLALALLWGLYAAGRVAAEAGAPALPAWQAVDFEQRAYGVIARSRVELDCQPDKDGALQLRATSVVSDNFETVELTLGPQDFRVLQRSRLSRGRDLRYKTFDYLPQHIVRERHEPSDGDIDDPEQWPVTSLREIAYPADSDGLAITDAYALLLLADRFQASEEEAVEVVVHTDFNFYRVRMTHEPGQEIPVDYRVSGKDGKVTGRRSTRAVQLEVHALGTPVDEPDFSLLGLQDDISLLFDRESGLLLQLRGTAPRIGYTTLNLLEVMPRDCDA